VREYIFYCEGSAAFMLLFIKKKINSFFQKVTINVIITQAIIKRQKSIGGSVGGKITPLIWAAKVQT
jgi:hypothetical protein